MGTPAAATYAIRGGQFGRDRLRVLAGVLEPSTSALLDRLDLAPDAACLDVGCGGADVTRLIARRVPHGSVVGTDRDAVKLDLARDGLPANVTLRVEDIAATVAAGGTYDLVYARFLLSHLRDAGDWVCALAGLVRRGGVLAVEDVRISASFCSPSSSAFDRTLQIYADTVRASGGDPELGPHLPRLLHEAGMTSVGTHVVQPAGLTGDAKRIQPLTLAGIRDAAIAAGTSDAGELDRLVDALHSFAQRPDTVVSTAQVVQAWGRTADPS